MPAPAAAAAAVSAAGKLTKLAAGAAKASSKGAAVGGRVALRGAKKYRRASKLYRLTSRVVGDVPVPVFGSARVASEWTRQKARNSLPRYAPWVVPVTAGGLWFAWPAIAAVNSESDEEEELSWLGLWTRLEEEKEGENDHVVAGEGGSTTNWNGVVLAGVGGGDGRPAASVASIAAAVDALRGPTTAVMATSPPAGRDPNDFSHLHAEWERFHLASINYSDRADEDDEEDEEEGDGDGDGDEDGSEEMDEQQGLGDRDVDGDKEPSKDDVTEEEEDEETQCSICLINRQGPCRDAWRFFERCIKENPLSGEAGSDDGRGGDGTSEEDSTDAGSAASTVAGKCDRFFQPWFECFSRHRTTYALITNRQVQPEMDMLEDTQDTEPFPPSLIPILNLEEEEAGSTGTAEGGGEVDADMEGSKDERPQSATIPDESNVTTRYVRFQLKNESTGNDIRVAYVRDQEGNLLGFDYFTTERKEGKTEGDMMFHVQPETKSVTIYGFYRNQEEEDDGDDANASGEVKKSETVEADSATKPKTVVDEKVYFKEMELSNTRK